MNGIHDLGGMDGMGPVDPEAHEPVFHEPWEGRVFGLRRLLGRRGLGRDWGSFRFAQESLPPADYLRLSYYERWFTALVDQLRANRIVTEAELARGAADPEAARPARLRRTPKASLGSGLLDLDAPARFRVDDTVRARNVHPRGHTRLPRYARGRRGTVIRDNGVYALQDTDGRGQQLGDFPQHVYTVRFTARELWGDRGSERDAVCVELWEEYLEPA